MEADIEKLSKEIERLRALVYYDHLTGAFNRLGFKEEAEKVLRISFGRSAVERRVGFQIPFSVLAIDIDDFKKINDTYGHHAGDNVLKEVAYVLQESLRETDLVARWGGEEFVAALLGADLKAAKKVGENLRSAVEKREILVDGHAIKVTISLGIAGYGKENSLEEIIHKADQAMYEAKRQGKNRVIVSE
mgnify:CR=1 FL=1